jgi:peptidylprolyl isomerase
VTWRNLRILPAAIALVLVTPLVNAAPAPATLAEIEAGAPASAWRAVAPDDLLLLDTPKGTLTIELAPAFAPAHVAAIRALVRAGAFSGGAVTRVQDNYVVQWGTKAAVAALAGPPGPAAAKAELPPEYERPAAAVAVTPLPYPDAYARAGFSDGWPVATDGTATWLVHCYGMVGAGRDNPPSTGDGSELYAVIGHAPRHLDRNLAVVGRAIDGLAPLAALPRGTGPLGFYATAPEMLPITNAMLASDIPDLRLRPHWQVMRTDTPTFAALIAARASRHEAFFVRPANGVDVCNVKIPVRRVP